MSSNFGKSETNVWWIPSASLTEQARHQKFMSEIQQQRNVSWDAELFPTLGHRISKGKGDILTYWDFFSGYTEISDSSSLILITIATTKPLIGQGEMSIGGESGATAFITTGNVGLHDFCAGYAIKGSIRYTSSASAGTASGSAAKNEGHTLQLLGVEKGVYAEISMEMDRVDPEGLSSEQCGRCIFDANLIFKPSDIPSANKVLK